MFKNHRTIEEEKVDISENIIPYSNTSNNTNYNLTNDIQSIMSNNNEINSSEIKPNYNYICNVSQENLNIKNNEFQKETLNDRPNKILNQETIPNNNVFKTIKITNKINQTDNKSKIKKNKNPKLVTINKEDLYNAFVLFQRFYSKYDTENENNIEYIKNKLFQFVSMQKNNFFSETIDCNDYEENDNENIFDVQNYMPIYCKSDKELNLNMNNENHNNHDNLIKSYSFSFSNNMNKILNNYFLTFLNDAKETIKSNSQIFSEYLLIDKKINEKTISPENSKSFRHNYSFDIKNKEKNELSFHSIPDKDKEKEKEETKYFMIEKNDMLDKNNFEKYNSYEKEIEQKSPFDKNGFRLFGNNLRKYSTEEDLLIDPFHQKNKNLNILEYDDNQNEENNNNNHTCKNKNSSIKEKIFISPSKPEINKFNSINNENSKNDIPQIQPRTTKAGVQEIKVNKNKSLTNKEQLINEKIKELNDEIAKFKEERNKVTLLKEEYEKLQDKLLKDIKDFNLKKQMSQKNYKGAPNSEVKLIMSITQHNQALILNNNKKKETIKLLRERINELENIIKAKNNIDHTNHKNIFKKIKNLDKKYFASERINIFTKKKNFKKKNNDSYILKKARINLKKKVESDSSEKNKGNKNNNKYNNSEIINQTMNNNINTNSINKIYIENKNIKANNYNKKLMNASYNNHNIKNNILNSKIPNYNINCFKKYVYNANSNKNFNGKKNNLNNNTNIIGINYRNNSINSAVFNKSNKLKIENPVIHTNLYIYEKLINKEREKEKNYKKLNINSERDHKKTIKELKTEIQDKSKIEKDKKSNAILYNNDNKFVSKKYQKSQGKNVMSNRLYIKTDIYKTKSNLNILGSYRTKLQNHSINKKNISTIQPLTRNTTNYSKNDKSRELKNNLKEINNSLDNKNHKKIKPQKIISKKKELDFIEDSDENGYDFVIPEIYKKNNDSEIINSVEQDGKIINIYNNHKKEIIFKSGVRKEIFMDGHQLVHFPNGDMKQKFVGKEEKVIYFYNETNTVQTTFKTGLNIFKFSNGQIEKHYPDGSKYIIYTNGIKRKISKSGREEVFIPDEKNKEKHEIEENILKDSLEKENKDETDNNDDKNLLLSFIDIEKY